jgi:multiple sugar transport system permease protein
MSAATIARPDAATAPAPAAARRSRRPGLVPTVVLLFGAAYCLLPVAWVLVASTKSSRELFSTFTFLPGTGFTQNIAGLTAYRDGVYWKWMLNSLFYAGFGALLSTAVSAVSGYALAKYRFRGRESIFNVLLTGVLMPPVILAIPTYLLMAKANLADSYLSVLLPSVCPRTASTSLGSTPPPPCRTMSSRRPGWTGRASGGSSSGSRCR